MLSNNQDVDDHNGNGHIQVVCRVRPFSKREISINKKEGFLSSCCLKVDNINNNIIIKKRNSQEERIFELDYCLNNNCSQEEVFLHVGLGITKRCMDGYNGTILCYGK